MYSPAIEIRDTPIVMANGRAPLTLSKYISTNNTNNSLLDTLKHLRIKNHVRTINEPLRDRVLGALASSAREKEAFNMQECGKQFRLYKASGCNTHIALPYYCGHRLCQICAQRRSAKFYHKLKGVFSRMSRPKMLTLTVKNVPKIDKAYFKWLRKCFSGLRRTKLWQAEVMCLKCEKKLQGFKSDLKTRRILNKKGKPGKFWGCKGCYQRFDEIVSGGCYSIETTYNEVSSDWHVHIHALIDSPRIDVFKLRTAWEKITGGSWGVDIRQASKSDTKEILKYECKLSDFVHSPQLVDEYLKAVKGMRLFHTFGDFFDSDLEDETEEELENPHSYKCDCGNCNWQFKAVIQEGYGYTDETGFYWDWETLQQVWCSTS